MQCKWQIETVRAGLVFDGQDIQPLRLSPETSR